MKLVWSQKLYLQDPWKPALEGVFFYQKSGVSFYFKDAGAVKCVCGCTNMPSVLFRPEARQLCIPLPRNWQVVNQVSDNFLMCNEEIAINLMNGVLINPVPDSMLREYRRKRLPDKHFEEDSFTLGEYQIRHKGQWGYICQKGGTDIWKFAGRAYLHTDMQREGDNLYFGTAGAGGYFYILNIHTGVPILSLRTGGTTVIQRRGSHAYLYTGVGQRKSQLICVDLISGNILDEMELPGIASDDRVLGLWEDCIYTMTFEYKSKRYYDQVKNVIYSCIALD